MIRIDLRSQTEWFSFYSGRYDDAAIALICSILSKFDGNFLDVGGNIGMYAVRIARRLEPGRRCICVEPMPANAQRIRENVSLNKLEDRIEVHEVALSDAEGNADLVLREDFEAGSQTGNASVAISQFADRNFKKISVPMQRFDKLLAQKEWTRIPVVKVDIEGHEDFFLRGAANWLND